jgi:hypothetical protein
MSLLDALETWPVDHPQHSLGRYDDSRGLRVDDDGQPVVDLDGSWLGTQTRGGADRDQAPATLVSLGTVTKEAGTDSDYVPRLLVTKTGAGRDDDREHPYAVLAGTRTLAGPDRD